MVGMVGIANRPGGYDQALCLALEPFLAVCADLFEASHARQLQHDLAGDDDPLSRCQDP